MNAEQIQNLQVGDQIERRLLGTGSWKPATITSITFRARREKDGRWFVGFYTTFGERSQISGSVVEGETSYYRLPEGA